VSDQPPLSIQISIWLWRRLIRDLGQLGQGRRESGAFLLGQTTGAVATVTSYITYDRLDPNAMQGGAIAFHANGYAALWKHCREQKLELIADCHTHPTADVRQSHIDQRHPMVPVVGHTAMIVPKFGRTGWWSLSGVGVYEHLGSFQWRTHNEGRLPHRVRLTLW